MLSCLVLIVWGFGVVFFCWRETWMLDCAWVSAVQGYLARKKPPSPRTVKIT
jgi:hypothetical protein